MNLEQNSTSSPSIDKEFADAVRDLERGGRTSIILGLAGQGIRSVMQVMLGWVLGAHIYGLYALGRSVFDIIGRFSLMGLHNGVVHFIAIFHGEGDRARIRGTILMALALVAVSSSVTGFGLWWTSDWVAASVFDKPALAPALRGFAMALPAYALLLVLASCARGFRHMGYYSGMTHVAHPLCVLLLVAGCFLFGMRLNGVLWGFGLSTALSCVLMFIALQRLFPSLLALREGFHFAGARILPYSAKVLLSGFTNLLLERLDRLMLGFFGLASDVGIYSMSAFVGHRIDFFLRMFSSIFAPMIATLYSQGQRATMARIFQTASKWTLILTLPVFFAFIFLSQAILSLFGRGFQAGWSVLVILSLGNLINVGVGPVGYMLTMTGRPGLELLNSWLSGVLNIILNLLLIPRYGAIGAAVATAVTMSLLNVIRLLQVHRAHRCTPFRLSTLKVLAAFALAGGAMWVLADVYQFALRGKLACLAGFMLIYAGLLFGFGWDEEDQLVLQRLGSRLGRLRRS